MVPLTNNLQYNIHCKLFWVIIYEESKNNEIEIGFILFHDMFFKDDM